MFDLDSGSARAADNKSAFIDEAGKYLGAFTRAEWMEKDDTGSTGIGFSFKNSENAEAQFYINLSYQHGKKNDGGHSLLNAIMACMKLRKVEAPRKITVEKWNSDTKQRDKVDVYGFPELMGPKIGLLIQMEIEKNSESGNPRPTIYMPFSAESEKTASEVLDGDKCRAPAKLEKAVQMLMNKPLVDRRPKGNQHQTGNTPSSDGPPDDWNDIPFD
ncbi:hypothetical protein [Pseudomonas segetis]|uniref:Uncharacterized protein n=1 Tax=Pseudomonas segetis TaxID=298908 RepID=A0A239C9Q4_9PSED|nr:hypothetical protein [Pseudomonas segetis]SNS16622.1 hypothetical protein SAMN05216255_1574 [Pseudomonas segetis]